MYRSFSSVNRFFLSREKSRERCSSGSPDIHSEEVKPSISLQRKSQHKSVCKFLH